MMEHRENAEGISYIGMDLKIFSNHDHSLNAESFYTL